MNIAIVYDLIYPYSIGGIEKRNWEIARRLVRKGHSVTLFGTKAWQGESVIEKEGVTLRGVGHYRRLYINGQRSLSEPVLVSLNLLFPLMREKFDVIEAANFPYFTCFSSKLACVIHASPLVITWHEVFDSHWDDYLGWLGAVGKLVERLTCKLSKNVAAVSSGTRDALARYYGHMPVEVIPNGVDCDQIAAIPAHPDRCDIIFAGRLVKEKNLDILIKAVRIIQKNRPNVICRIVGDGPEHRALIQLADGLDLNNNIRFEPFLKDQSTLFSYMKSSKVFALPSTREGFGIIVLEANACGLPVVTVDHPRNEARSLITPENGFVAAAEPAAFARCIERALESDMKASSIKFAAGYSWDNVADKTEAFFLRCLARSK